uniref:Ion transport domain-containing protein n=1 Tax=Ditylenchus dipsaci TaxID=166011 RepID=A0A915CZ64_9BILA
MANSRLDLEQKKPLSEENTIGDRLAIYNQRKGSGRGEIINRHVLRKLKEKGHWKVLRHPLVLNWINEKCLSCTAFYALHVLLYFVFLFLLYSYVHGRPTVVKNMFVTAIILFFVFFLLVKAALKLQTGVRSVSFWFLASYLFNIATYALTLFYIWSFHFFNFDNYHEEVKKTVSWFLPIIAILSSWINCLFLNTTIIWIPTLLCFAFSFQLIMRDSGTQPWDDTPATNSSFPTVIMAILQSFTKTSAMMIGEVEANDILERKTWIANLLLILFEIITVILLMNLMISLAVGDVNELRLNAEERLLKIKVNFCIEALHLSEQITLLDGLACIRVLHRAHTNNVLVIYKNSDTVYSKRIQAIRARFFNEASPATDPKTADIKVPDPSKEKHPPNNTISVDNQPLPTSSTFDTTTSTSFYSIDSRRSSSSTLVDWQQVASRPLADSAAIATSEQWTIASSSTHLDSYKTALDYELVVGAQEHTQQKVAPQPELHPLLSPVKKQKVLDNALAVAKVYDFVLSSTGIRVRKETLTNKATLMCLQGMTLHLVEASPSGINPLTDAERFKELQALKDEETHWRKFQSKHYYLNINAQQD